MSNQCVVAVGAEDDWRVSASARDERVDAFSQGGTWTVQENGLIDGNAGTERFLLSENRGMAEKMPRCAGKMNMV